MKKGREIEQNKKEEVTEFYEKEKERRNGSETRKIRYV